MKQKEKKQEYCINCGKILDASDINPVYTDRRQCGGCNYGLSQTEQVVCLGRCQGNIFIPLNFSIPDFKETTICPICQAKGQFKEVVPYEELE